METKKLKWEDHDDLKKGDIIRTKVGNKEHPRYGEYVYSVCSGSGFGCRIACMGNAIFVDHESFDLDEVIAKKDAPTSFETGSRWERFWGIEVLNDEVGQ